MNFSKFIFLTAAVGFVSIVKQADAGYFDNSNDGGYPGRFSNKQGSQYWGNGQSQPSYSSNYGPLGSGLNQRSPFESMNGFSPAYNNNPYGWGYPSNPFNNYGQPRFPQLSGIAPNSGIWTPQSHNGATPLQQNFGNPIPPFKNGASQQPGSKQPSISGPQQNNGMVIPQTYDRVPQQFGNGQPHNSGISNPQLNNRAPHDPQNFKNPPPQISDGAQQQPGSKQSSINRPQQHSSNVVPNSNNEVPQFPGNRQPQSPQLNSAYPQQPQNFGSPSPQFNNGNNPYISKPQPSYGKPWSILKNDATQQNGLVGNGQQPAGNLRPQNEGIIPEGHSVPQTSLTNKRPFDANEPALISGATSSSKPILNYSFRPAGVNPTEDDDFEIQLTWVDKTNIRPKPRPQLGPIGPFGQFGYNPSPYGPQSGVGPFRPGSVCSSNLLPWFAQFYPWFIPGYMNWPIPQTPANQIPYQLEYIFNEKFPYGVPTPQHKENGPWHQLTWWSLHRLPNGQSITPPRPSPHDPNYEGQMQSDLSSYPDGQGTTTKKPLTSQKPSPQDPSYVGQLQIDWSNYPDDQHHDGQGDTTLKPLTTRKPSPQNPNYDGQLQIDWSDYPDDQPNDSEGTTTTTLLPTQKPFHQDPNYGGQLQLPLTTQQPSAEVPTTTTTPSTNGGHGWIVYPDGQLNDHQGTTTTTPNPVTTHKTSPQVPTYNELGELIIGWLNNPDSQANDSQGTTTTTPVPTLKPLHQDPSYGGQVQLPLTTQQPSAEVPTTTTTPSPNGGHGWIVYPDGQLNDHQGTTTTTPNPLTTKKTSPQVPTYNEHGELIIGWLNNPDSQANDSQGTTTTTPVPTLKPSHQGPNYGGQVQLPLTNQIPSAEVPNSESWLYYPSGEVSNGQGTTTTTPSPNGGHGWIVYPDGQLNDHQGTTTTTPNPLTTKKTSPQVPTYNEHGELIIGWLNNPDSQANDSQGTITTTPVPTLKPLHQDPSYGGQVQLPLTTQKPSAEVPTTTTTPSPNGGHGWIVYPDGQLNDHQGTTTTTPNPLTTIKTSPQVPTYNEHGELIIGWLNNPDSQANDSQGTTTTTPVPTLKPLHQDPSYGGQVQLPLTTQQPSAEVPTTTTTPSPNGGHGWIVYPDGQLNDHQGTISTTPNPLTTYKTSPQVPTYNEHGELIIGWLNNPDSQANDSQGTTTTTPVPTLKPLHQDPSYGGQVQLSLTTQKPAVEVPTTTTTPSPNGGHGWIVYPDGQLNDHQGTTTTTPNPLTTKKTSPQVPTYNEHGELIIGWLNNPDSQANDSQGTTTTTPVPTLKPLHQDPIYGGQVQLSLTTQKPAVEVPTTTTTPSPNVGHGWIVYPDGQLNDHQGTTTTTPNPLTTKKTSPQVPTYNEHGELIIGWLNNPDSQANDSQGTTTTTPVPTLKPSHQGPNYGGQVQLPLTNQIPSAEVPNSESWLYYPSGEVSNGQESTTTTPSPNEGHGWIVYPDGQLNDHQGTTTTTQNPLTTIKTSPQVPTYNEHGELIIGWLNNPDSQANDSQGTTTTTPVPTLKPLHQDPSYGGQVQLPLTTQQPSAEVPTTTTTPSPNGGHGWIVYPDGQLNDHQGTISTTPNPLTTYKTSPQVPTYNEHGELIIGWLNNPDSQANDSQGTTTTTPVPTLKPLHQDPSYGGQVQLSLTTQKPAVEVPTTTTSPSPNGGHGWIVYPDGQLNDHQGTTTTTPNPLTTKKTSPQVPTYNEHGELIIGWLNNPDSQANDSQGTTTTTPVPTLKPSHQGPNYGGQVQLPLTNQIPSAEVPNSESWLYYPSGEVSNGQESTTTTPSPNEGHGWIVYPDGQLNDHQGTTTTTQNPLTTIKTSPQVPTYNEHGELIIGWLNNPDSQANDSQGTTTTTPVPTLKPLHQDPSYGGQVQLPLTTQQPSAEVPTTTTTPSPNGVHDWIVYPDGQLNDHQGTISTTPNPLTTYKTSPQVPTYNEHGELIIEWLNNPDSQANDSQGTTTTTPVPTLKPLHQDPSYGGQVQLSLTTQKPAVEVPTTTTTPSPNGGHGWIVYPDGQLNDHQGTTTTTPNPLTTKKTSPQVPTYNEHGELIIGWLNNPDSQANDSQGTTTTTPVPTLKPSHQGPNYGGQVQLPLTNQIPSAEVPNSESWLYYPSGEVSNGQESTTTTPSPNEGHGWIVYPDGQLNDHQGTTTTTQNPLTTIKTSPQVPTYNEHGELIIGWLNNPDSQANDSQGTTTTTPVPTLKPLHQDPSYGGQVQLPLTTQQPSAEVPTTTTTPSPNGVHDWIVYPDGQLNDHQGTISTTPNPLTTYKTSPQVPTYNEHGELIIGWLNNPDSQANDSQGTTTTTPVPTLKPLHQDPSYGGQVQLSLTTQKPAVEVPTTTTTSSPNEGHGWIVYPDGQLNDHQGITTTTPNPLTTIKTAPQVPTYNEHGELIIGWLNNPDSQANDSQGTTTTTPVPTLKPSHQGPNYGGQVQLPLTNQIPSAEVPNSESWLYYPSGEVSNGQETTTTTPSPNEGHGWIVYPDGQLNDHQGTTTTTQNPLTTIKTSPQVPTYNEHGELIIGWLNNPDSQANDSQGTTTTTPVPTLKPLHQDPSYGGQVQLPLTTQQPSAEVPTTTTTPSPNGGHGWIVYPDGQLNDHQGTTTTTQNPLTTIKTSPQVPTYNEHGELIIGWLNNPDSQANDSQGTTTTTPVPTLKPLHQDPSYGGQVQLPLTTQQPSAEVPTTTTTPSPNGGHGWIVYPDGQLNDHQGTTTTTPNPLTTKKTSPQVPTYNEHGELIIGWLNNPDSQANDSQGTTTTTPVPTLKPSHQGPNYGGQVQLPLTNQIPSAEVPNSESWLYYPSGEVSNGQETTTTTPSPNEGHGWIVYPDGQLNDHEGTTTTTQNPLTTIKTSPQVPTYNEHGELIIGWLNNPDSQANDSQGTTTTTPVPTLKPLHQDPSYGGQVQLPLTTQQPSAEVPTTTTTPSPNGGHGWIVYPDGQLNDHQGTTTTTQNPLTTIKTSPQVPTYNEHGELIIGWLNNPDSQANDSQGTTTTTPVPTLKPLHQDPSYGGQVQLPLTTQQPSAEVPTTTTTPSPNGGHGWIVYPDGQLNDNQGTTTTTPNPLTTKKTSPQVPTYNEHGELIIGWLNNPDSQANDSQGTTTTTPVPTLKPSHQGPNYGGQVQLPLTNQIPSAEVPNSESWLYYPSGEVSNGQGTTTTTPSPNGGHGWIVYPNGQLNDHQGTTTTTPNPLTTKKTSPQVPTYNEHGELIIGWLNNPDSQANDSQGTTSTTPVPTLKPLHQDPNYGGQVQLPLTTQKPSLEVSTTTTTPSPNGGHGWIVYPDGQLNDHQGTTTTTQNPLTTIKTSPQVPTYNEQGELIIGWLNNPDSQANDIQGTTTTTPVPTLKPSHQGPNYGGQVQLPLTTQQPSAEVPTTTTTPSPNGGHGWIVYPDGQLSDHQGTTTTTPNPLTTKKTSPQVPTYNEHGELIIGWLNNPDSQANDSQGTTTTTPVPTLKPSHQGPNYGGQVQLPLTNQIPSAEVPNSESWLYYPSGEVSNGQETTTTTPSPNEGHGWIVYPDGQLSDHQGTTTTTQNPLTTIKTSPQVPTYNEHGELIIGWLNNPDSQANDSQGTTTTTPVPTLKPLHQDPSYGGQVQLPLTTQQPSAEVPTTTTTPSPNGGHGWIVYPYGQLNDHQGTTTTTPNPLTTKKTSPQVPTYNEHGELIIGWLNNPDSQANDSQGTTTTTPVPTLKPLHQDPSYGGQVQLPLTTQQPSAEVPTTTTTPSPNGGHGWIVYPDGQLNDHQGTTTTTPHPLTTKKTSPQVPTYNEHGELIIGWLNNPDSQANDSQGTTTTPTLKPLHQEPSYGGQVQLPLTTQKPPVEVPTTTTTPSPNGGHGWIVYPDGQLNDHQGTTTTTPNPLTTKKASPQVPTYNEHGELIIGWLNNPDSQANDSQGTTTTTPVPTLKPLHQDPSFGGQVQSPLTTQKPSAEVLTTTTTPSPNGGHGWIVYPNGQLNDNQGTTTTTQKPLTAQKPSPQNPNYELHLGIDGILEYPSDQSHLEQNSTTPRNEPEHGASWDITGITQHPSKTTTTRIPGANRPAGGELEPQNIPEVGAYTNKPDGVGWTLTWGTSGQKPKPKPTTTKKPQTNNNGGQMSYTWTSQYPDENPSGQFPVDLVTYPEPQELLPTQQHGANWTIKWSTQHPSKTTTTKKPTANRPAGGELLYAWLMDHPEEQKPSEEPQKLLPTQQHGANWTIKWSTQHPSKTTTTKKPTANRPAGGELLYAWLMDHPEEQKPSEEPQNIPEVGAFTNMPHGVSWNIDWVTSGQKPKPKPTTTKKPQNNGGQISYTWTSQHPEENPSGQFPVDLPTDLEPHELLPNQQHGSYSTIKWSTQHPSKTTTTIKPAANRPNRDEQEHPEEQQPSEEVQNIPEVSANTNMTQELLPNQQHGANWTIKWSTQHPSKTTTTKKPTANRPAGGELLYAWLMDHPEEQKPSEEPQNIPEVGAFTNMPHGVSWNIDWVTSGQKPKPKPTTTKKPPQVNGGQLSYTWTSQQNPKPKTTRKPPTPSGSGITYTWTTQNVGQPPQNGDVPFSVPPGSLPDPMNLLPTNNIPSSQNGGYSYSWTSSEPIKGNGQVPSIPLNGIPGSFPPNNMPVNGVPNPPKGGISYSWSSSGPVKSNGKLPSFPLNGIPGIPGSFPPNNMPVNGVKNPPKGAISYSWSSSGPVKGNGQLPSFPLNGIPGIPGSFPPNNMPDNGVLNPPKGGISYSWSSSGPVKGNGQVPSIPLNGSFPPNNVSVNGVPNPPKGAITYSWSSSGPIKSNGQLPSFPLNGIPGSFPPNNMPVNGVPNPPKGGISYSWSSSGPIKGNEQVPSINGMPQIPGLPWESTGPVMGNGQAPKPGQTSISWTTTTNGGKPVNGMVQNPSNGAQIPGLQNLLGLIPGLNQQSLPSIGNQVISASGTLPISFNGATPGIPNIQQLIPSLQQQSSSQQSIPGGIKISWTNKATSGGSQGLTGNVGLNLNVGTNSNNGNNLVQQQ